LLGVRRSMITEGAVEGVKRTDGFRQGATPKGKILTPGTPRVASRTAALLVATATPS